MSGTSDKTHLVAAVQQLLSSVHIQVHQIVRRHRVSARQTRQEIPELWNDLLAKIWLKERRRKLLLRLTSYPVVCVKSGSFKYSLSK